MAAMTVGLKGDKKVDLKAAKKAEKKAATTALQ